MIYYTVSLHCLHLLIRLRLRLRTIASADDYHDIQVGIVIPCLTCFFPMSLLPVFVPLRIFWMLASPLYYPSRNICLCCVCTMELLNIFISLLIWREKEFHILLFRLIADIFLEVTEGQWNDTANQGNDEFPTHTIERNRYILHWATICFTSVAWNSLAVNWVVSSSDCPLARELRSKWQLITSRFWLEWTCVIPCQKKSAHDSS